MDIEILSNYCRICEKSSDEEHECQLNHEGSANSMEPVGAVNIFKRSVESRGLKYTEYLGDWDRSAFKAVCDIKVE